jgi:hypothetical protein
MIDPIDRVKITVENYAEETGLGHAHTSVNNADAPDDVGSGIRHAICAVLPTDCDARGAWAILWAALGVLEDDEFVRINEEVGRARFDAIRKALKELLATADGVYRHCAFPRAPAVPFHEIS